MCVCQRVGAVCGELSITYCSSAAYGFLSHKAQHSAFGRNTAFAKTRSNLQHGVEQHKTWGTPARIPCFAQNLHPRRR